MLNIPEAVKQLFKSGESQNYSMSINVGTTKYFTTTLYTIPEENIKGESAELRETLFSGNNPKFGTIQTSQFTVSLLNFNLLLKGKYIRVFLHYGPALNIIPYGEFYVESVEKTPYSSETKLICYDYSYFLNVQAANKIRRIPTTTANTAISMCEAIFDKLHLQYTPFTSSTTYNYVTKIPDNTTYGNMLEWMGELYGGWWKPDRYGVFRFVQIGSSASPESVDTFRPKAGEHETSQIPDFTGIIFNSLLRLEETKEQDYLYGSDDGLVYTMDKSNPYIVNYNESQLNALGQTLLPIYNSIKYIPNKIKIDGRPYLECGDWYTYLTDDDTEDQIRITAPVIQSIISGIGALNQTLQAVGQSQTTGTLDGTEYNQSSERTAIKDTQTIVSTSSQGGGNKIYISELAPTVEDNAIGNEGDLWYKVKRRGHFEGAVLKCIRAGKMTEPDMEFTVGQYVRVNYGNYYNNDHPYLKEWGPTNWSGWPDYEFIALSNMEGIASKLSSWGNFPGYYPWLYGNQSLRLWTCNYDEERMITSNEVARGGFGRTAAGYNIHYIGNNYGRGADVYIGGILNNIEYNAEESDEHMVDPAAVKAVIDGLALFEIVDWGEGTNYNYDGTIIERMVLERYIKYDGVWVKADYKAGKGIVIADGEIRINTSTSVDIIQTVTSGTQLATINGTSIYAPTVSASQTQTSGTEIATINIGDTSTKLYAPTTTVTQTLTEGTEIGEVNGTKLYAPTGGGSDVTVTPKTSTGTNIADIEVNGTTYQLFAPSGGGGGSGSGYTETSLWSGYKADTGTITLNDSVENYDIILIKVTSHPSQPSNKYYESYFTILPSGIIYSTSPQYEILVVRGNVETGNGSMDCYFASSTSFVIKNIYIDSNARNVKPAVLEVIGLKFGGSSGHNYSTDEQIIGTWIDGSTLYEKTYTYSFTASSNDYDYTIATLSSEINPQSIETNAFRRDGILFKELIYPPGNIYCRYAIDNNVLSTRVFNSSGSTFEGTVTIRYTKTS